LIENKKIGLYPNLTSEKIMVICDQPPVVITIFDSNGNSLLSQTVSQEITKVDISIYAKDIYLATAQNGLS